jgi:RNA polymerase sigma-70 factor (sigma-E family)
MSVEIRGEVFAEFVRQHTRSLFSTAFLLTGSRERAEDLLQETLTALYPKWDRVEAADHPAAYVRKAITNRFLNSVRSAGREVVAWEVPDSWDGIDVSEQVAASRTVWQLLGELGERQRAAVVLHYFHDQSDEEIGAGIGCRRSTARSLISRGLATMRAALDERTSDRPDLGAQR